MALRVRGSSAPRRHPAHRRHRGGAYARTPWARALALVAAALSGCGDADAGASTGEAGTTSDGSATSTVGTADASASTASSSTAATSDPSTSSSTTDTGEPPGDPGVDAEQWCARGELNAIEQRIDALLTTLTPAEKVELMAGSSIMTEAGVYLTPGVPAAGLPGLRMIDGPRGVSKGAGTATAFPVGSARGATWDPELERRVGAAIGREARAKAASVLLAPTVNVLRHPRWGRAQETYGEDSFHIARMGVGFIQGAQTEVLASVKHLAANSIEDTRFVVSVQIDERTLREIYLEPFRAAVREGLVASVMSAYNRVNGQYAAQNPLLLRTVLKDGWGFPGFVESDWVFGTRSTLPSLEAGLDIEMPVADYYGEPLLQAVADGTADLARIDEAVRRIARAQWCYALDTDPPALDPSAVETAEHLALAREVAERAATLLVNREGALPLARSGTIAVVGPLADVENIGDEGSSDVAPSEVVTVLEGLQAAAGAATVTAVPLPLDLAGEAVLAAADHVVIVVGLTSDDEGESLLSAGDRDTLALPAEQVALIEQVDGLAQRVVVVLQGGSSLVVEPWVDRADALLMAWYPGARGGEAVARVLFGDAEPTGRSPVTWPVTEADLPPFDNRSNEVVYDAWHGYRHLARTATTARFPFGFGLGYGDVSYGAPAIEGPAAGTAMDVAEVRVRVPVTNAGPRATRETVQVYVTPPTGPEERSPFELEGFVQVDVGAGETVDAELSLLVRRWSVWSEEGWVVRPGTYTLRIARHAEDPGRSADLALEGGAVIARD